MRAWRRGLIKETYPAYRLRGEVSRELVLYMMAAEEDAEQASVLAATTLRAYAPHISNPDKLTDFARRQTDIGLYAVDRRAYKRVDWRTIGKSDLENDKTIQAMIERFKYIKEHGIMSEKEATDGK